ncbi:translation initiation factor IF-2-like [Pristis pectinata]|uniref:translation initiation factor IF-2-like n=1 Tax=Pristis pectinata TaxID=685728 RepID=UPI00223CB4F5|nr:translation initiation factor IF-2-like [Pristis pectinata]
MLQKQTTFVTPTANGQPPHLPVGGATPLSGPAHRQRTTAAHLEVGGATPLSGPAHRPRKTAAPHAAPAGGRGHAALRSRPPPTDNRRTCRWAGPRRSPVPPPRPAQPTADGQPPHLAVGGATPLSGPAAPPTADGQPPHLAVGGATPLSGPAAPPTADGQPPHLAVGGATPSARDGVRQVARGAREAAREQVTGRRRRRRAGSHGRGLQPEVCAKGVAGCSLTGHTVPRFARGSRSRGEDALAAKGLLCVKVQVGLTQKGHQIVGYVSCTHLHATAEDSHIRQSQLSHIVGWISEFLSATGCKDEKVVFDVLCGDFNFDNCSLEDHLEQQHQILKMYKDPCCIAPGKEKPGVVGTLLEQGTMYEEPVISPENLQRALEIDELRKQYLAFPVNSVIDTAESPESSTVGGGRRIDYLLYREDTVAKEVTTEVEEFTFITQLAGLTDHLPIGMRLFVSMATEDNDVICDDEV